jgi:hypothetical protein
LKDKCPTCDRAFQGLEDYPFIYLARFKRVEIPLDISLPFYDRTVFVGPNSDVMNERPPREVSDFFREHNLEECFVYDGWKWSLRGEWDIGKYRRELDQRSIIISRLNPYFDTLDRFVGKNVETSRLFPPFERDDYSCELFNIPDTDYFLRFDEGRKTSSGLRVATLKLIGESSDMQSDLSMGSLAEVGRLEYEGRLRKSLLSFFGNKFLFKGLFSE